jgi:hypothetical protein
MQEGNPAPCKLHAVQLVSQPNPACSPRLSNHSSFDRRMLVPRYRYRCMDGSTSIPSHIPSVHLFSSFHIRIAVQPFFLLTSSFDTDHVAKHNRLNQPCPFPADPQHSAISACRSGSHPRTLPLPRTNSLLPISFSLPTNVHVAVAKTPKNLDSGASCGACKLCYSVRDVKPELSFPRCWVSFVVE